MIPGPTGGPLEQGDIDDLEGRTCVVCPWHRYAIDLNTGDSLYLHQDIFDRSQPPCVRSKGAPKQRTHAVRESRGVIEVRLSTDGSFASDRYVDDPRLRALLVSSRP